MSARSPSDTAFVGLDVLQAAIDPSTGYITVQLGNVVTGVARSDEAEVHQPFGYAAMPRKPDAGSKAAQVVVLTRGDHDAVIGCRDERTAAIYGSLDYGETAVFASVAGGAVIVFDKNGGATLTSGDIKLGDSSAVALAKASAISDLQSAINGWVVSPNDGGAALKTALTTWIANNYATTKAKGT